MATAVLQECRIRADRVVLVKGSAPRSWEWSELRKEFTSSRDPRGALGTLRAMRPESFLGLISGISGSGDNATCFLLRNTDRSNRIGWLLKKDPSFEKRLLKIYKVLSVHWDDRVVESDNTG